MINNGAALNTFISGQSSEKNLKVLDKWAFFVYNNSENTSHRIGGTCMKAREMAVNVIDMLDDDSLLDFFKLFGDDNMLALAESELIAKNPNRTHYNSFADILKEINEEQDYE